MSPILATIGAHVRSLRKQRGLTQIELGQKIGLNPNLLGRIERGDQNPALLTLAKVADGLGVSLEELVKGCPPFSRSRTD
ncbi:MAG: helix-turn-helix transcriptional regulator [Sphingomonadaceae bacterium]